LVSLSSRPLPASHLKNDTLRRKGLAYEVMYFPALSS